MSRNFLRISTRFTIIPSRLLAASAERALAMRKLVSGANDCSLKYKLCSLVLPQRDNGTPKIDRNRQTVKAKAQHNRGDGAAVTLYIKKIRQF